MKWNDDITQLILSALLAINPKCTGKDLAHFINDYKELSL